MSYELFAAIKRYYDAREEAYLTDVPLHFEKAPQNTPAPYITVSIVSDVAEHDWPASWDTERCQTYRVQFSVFSTGLDAGYGVRPYGTGAYAAVLSGPEHAIQVSSDLRDAFYRAEFTVDRYVLHDVVEESTTQFRVKKVSQVNTDFFFYLHKIAYGWNGYGVYPYGE